MKWYKFKSACVFLLYGMASVVHGQSKIKFDTLIHDFGTIEEDNELLEHTFTFINIGDAPLRIRSVQAACGCTVPEWTKTEVVPGDSGFVKASYNPLNRPGRFEKSLDVVTSEPPTSQRLFIVGMVKPKLKNPEQEFPVSFGGFRLKQPVLNMGKITTEKPVTKSFDIYNENARDPMLRFHRIPDFLVLALSPPFLKKGEKGTLHVSYDAKKKNDLGQVSDQVVLSSPRNATVSVAAIIEEYFPEMSEEELRLAPKLRIDSTSFDFGKVAQGEIIETSFELMNAGQETLTFRKIKSSCECVTFKLNDDKIKKGKSKTLSVIFDTSQMRGNQYKSIMVYSNDPINPTRFITLKGKVEVKK